MRMNLKRMAWPLAVAAAACMLPCNGQTSQESVVMNIDASQTRITVSPTLYGLFYEEINHAGEGGLYAELIGNRSFEDEALTRRRRSHQEAMQPAVIPAWSLAVPQDCKAAIALEKEDAKQLNRYQKNALKWDIESVAAGQKVRLDNEGFWGINAVKGRTYHLTFWARAEKPYEGTLQVGLAGEKGNLYAATPVQGKIGNGWNKYEVSFTATADDGQAHFYMAADHEGTLYLDMVSLFPPTYKNRENGLRPDLAQMLEAIHPKFIRFPGGCFVEGCSRESGFNWRATLGPIEERPGHMNLNWGYRCTDGFGYHEMLQMCEDMGAAPLFVVNIGIWHGGYQPYDSIDEYVQSALDAIEYANGGVNTQYGALRAENGHPAPFNLQYLEVGNENYQPDAASQSDHYAERYAQFYKAVKAKYPNIQIIGNVEAWGTDSPTWRNSNPVDLLDEHYYRTPAWFARNFHKYDSYDRKGPKIYTGEYAVTSDCGEGNMNAALGEAIYMMGMENNSDVVAMCSYAPIFVNWNDRRWMPDMIRFTSSQAYGSPSYWVQQLFSHNVGSRMIGCNLTVPKVEKKQDFTVGLGSWLSQVDYKDACVVVSGDTTRLSFADTSKWKAAQGDWSSKDGIYSQTSPDENCTSIFNGLHITAPKYTYIVKACKRGGDEGFLVLFNVSGNRHYYWLNIGGWGNTATAVEDVAGNGKSTVTTRRGHVENDVWYTVRIEVDGKNVACFVDNEEVSRFKVGDDAGQVFANAQIDEAKKELIVKMVNFGENSYPATLNLKKALLAKDAIEITTLSSAQGTDENTFEKPNAIVPVTTKQAVKGSKISIQLAPYSVNIIRVKLLKSPMP